MEEINLEIEKSKLRIKKLKKLKRMQKQLKRLERVAYKHPYFVFMDFVYFLIDLVKGGESSYGNKNNKR